MAHVFTTIRNMLHQDFEELDPDLVITLRDAEREQQLVRVLYEVTDGYYDVQLQDGTIVPAICWYHLDGFTVRGVCVSDINTPKIVN